MPGEMLTAIYVVRRLTCQPINSLIQLLGPSSHSNVNLGSFAKNQDNVEPGIYFQIMLAIG